MSQMVNNTVVICLQPDALSAVARLRADRRGWQICEADGALWLRGELGGTDNTELLSLPGRRYSVLPDDNRQLVPAGLRVPQAYLPDGDWQPLNEWLQLRLSHPAVAGAAPPPARLELVRDVQSRETNVLLTTAADWAEFAGVAAGLRLGRLTFAAATTGEMPANTEDARESHWRKRRPVIVRGAPSPPIPGTAFVEVEGIAVPAGWRWSPALDASVLRAAFGSASKDLILLLPDGTCERIPADAFVSANRHAARQLLEGTQ